MSARDRQMVILGMLCADILSLAVWWALGRSDRRTAGRETDPALAEAQAALDRVRAIAKAPARSDFNRYANAQDDGWDQALAEVRAALAVEVDGVDESAAEPARLVRPVTEQPVSGPQSVDESSTDTCQVVHFDGELEAGR